MAYHDASKMVSPPPGGFAKTARLTQVVMRLADIGDLAEAGMVPFGVDRGENLLVEFALSSLLDCINEERWGMANDIIDGFPACCSGSSKCVFDKLVELRRKFEATPGREVVLDDLCGCAWQCR